jgi:hypothetical protein
MKNLIVLIIIAGMITFISCGSSWEENSETIRQDSIAEIEKIKMDSVDEIVNIKMDSVDKNEKKIKNTIADIDGYKSYYDKKSKVSIKYPPDWEMINEGFEGLVFGFLVPLDEASYDFRESINLTIADSYSGMSKKEYEDLAISNLREYVGNMVIIESKDVTLNGYDTYISIYTCKNEGKNLKVKQLYIFMNSKVYVLTFTAKQNSYGKFINIVNKIFSTIRIK